MDVVTYFGYILNIVFPFPSLFCFSFNFILCVVLSILVSFSGLRAGLVGGRGLGALPGPVFGTVGGGGVFWEPLEKTVMFLIAPKQQNSVARRGVSDERSRPKAAV